MRVFFKKRVKLELNGEIKLANFFEMLCVAVFLVFYHPPLHVSFVATCDSVTCDNQVNLVLFFPNVPEIKPHDDLSGAVVCVSLILCHVCVNKQACV